jgi:hypothetical protein
MGMNKLNMTFDPTQPLSIDETAARLPELVALAMTGLPVRIEAAGLGEVTLTAEPATPERDDVKSARERVLAWLATGPPTAINPWTREDLYQRG